MTFPNLIIPGAGKSGTSSLHRYLNQHPDIYMSAKKEPAYFFKDELYQKETEWYSKLFEPGKNCKYRGESSTYYFKYQPSLERMKKDLENPKFIILLRHPIKRIISHYFWLWGKGLEFRSFRKAVEYDMNEEFRPGYNIKKHYKCYIQNSFYYKWIKNYSDFFGRENIYIVTNEMMKKNPLETVNSCFSFLGLKQMENIDITLHNESIHRNVPLWDKYILHLLFTVNDRNLFFKTKEKIIPEFLKKNYWKLHNKITQNRFLNKKPDISKEDYQWLFNLLKDDVKQLKSFLNYNFDEWEDFKSQ